MSDLDYNPDNMSFNEDDRTFVTVEIDKVYKRVAEVVIKQNERFFLAQEKQNRKICELEGITSDHERRLLILEKERLKRMVKKLAIVVAILIVGTLTVLIII